MKTSFTKYLNKGHERTVKAKKNILGLFALRVINIVIGLLLVPVTLEYLDETKYGIWITLTSIISWAAVFNVGLGNGLRNKLAESLALDKMQLARKYVSTTYFLIALIFGIIFIVFSIINPYVPWHKILNTPFSLNDELIILAYTVFGFFCLKMVGQLISTVYNAHQRPAMVSVYQTIARVCTLIGVLILVKANDNSLIKLGFVLSVMPVITFFAANIVGYAKTFEPIKPSFKFINLAYSKDLIGLSAKFFIVQIAGIILYTTDNIIITQLFSPAEVTPYQIAHKYFGIVLMLFIIIVTPFWSAITDAYTKKEYWWIKKSIKKLILIWLLAILGLIVMLVFSNYAYEIWIGNRTQIPFSLSAFWAIFVAIQSLNAIFVHFINGTGFVKLQMIVGGIAAVLNIPLSILFAKTFELGVDGVIVATIVTQFITLIIVYIQYKKIINSRATGVWFK